jgi:hypothetical protein
MKVKHILNKKRKLVFFFLVNDVKFCQTRKLSDKMTVHVGDVFTSFVLQKYTKRIQIRAGFTNYRSRRIRIIRK